MTFPVELRIAPSVAGSVGARRDAGHAAVALEEGPKFVGVEALVPDEDHGLGQKRQDLFGTCRFRTLTGEEEEGHDVSLFINGRGELRVVTAFGKPNCLILRASDRPLASLMDLDEGAVDETQFALRLTGQVSKDFGPETGIHPPAPTAVDGVPPTPLRRKSPPPTSLPQDMKNGPENMVRGKRWSFCFLCFP